MEKKLVDTIYQHFRPDEKEFIDQVLNWRQSVEDTYSPRLTDFLDPRQLHIVHTLIGKNADIKIKEHGGYNNAERKRVLIFPDYYIPEEEDFQISLIEIEYPSKFVSIEHRQILGTLMSLGLKREKYGDILIDEERIQFFTGEELSNYIISEVQQIGKASVKLIKKPLHDRIHSYEEWMQVNTTASSLRLDVILSSIYNISRQKAQTLIQRGLVKVNWKQVEQTSFVCEEGDVLSARGYGRSRIISIDGQTKKEKWRLTAGILK
jgi:RNA-binding protein YlmH